MNNLYGRNQIERKIKRGEAYYITREPICGSEQQAGRPAIIVSNDANNMYSDTYEVVYLTTQEKTDLPTHTTIRSCQKESTALCEQISTVSVNRIGDYMCKLSPEEMDAVDTCLAISIGLTKVQETVSIDPIEDRSDDEFYASTAGTDDEEEEAADIICELHTELTKAQAERDVYEKLYKDLLEKMMNK